MLGEWGRDMVAHLTNQTFKLGIRHFQTEHSELRGVFNFKYEFDSSKIRRWTIED